MFASAAAFLHFPVSNVTLPTHSGASKAGLQRDWGIAEAPLFMHVFCKKVTFKVKCVIFGGLEEKLQY